MYQPVIQSTPWGISAPRVAPAQPQYPRMAAVPAQPTWFPAAASAQPIRSTLAQPVPIRAPSPSYYPVPVRAASPVVYASAPVAVARPASPVAFVAAAPQIVRPASPVAFASAPIARPASPVAFVASPIARPASPVAFVSSPIARPASPVAFVSSPSVVRVISSPSPVRAATKSTGSQAGASPAATKQPPVPRALEGGLFGKFGRKGRRRRQGGGEGKRGGGRGRGRGGGGGGRRGGGGGRRGGGGKRWNRKPREEAVQAIVDLPTGPPDIDDPDRLMPSGNAEFDEAAAVCFEEVQAIIAQCREQGIKFEDEEFIKSTEGGADSANPDLDGTEQEGVEWKRLTEICDGEPQLFVDGSTEGDVVQGQLGSCYLLSALATLSTVPNLVERLFVAHSHEVGVYGIMLFDAEERRWGHVVIDDLVPVETYRDDEPMYAHGEEDTELWVALIEKAYAKRGRNGVSNLYANIAGGRPEDAMVECSGGVKSVLVRGYPGFDFETINRLCDTRRHVLAAGSYESENGIYRGHAYSVLEGYELETGEQLLCLRNPWGNTEWEGRYSDYSEEMTDELREQLDHEDGDDGVFFMCWEDFARIFGDVGVAELPEGFLTEDE